MASLIERLRDKFPAAIDKDLRFAIIETQALKKEAADEIERLEGLLLGPPCSECGSETHGDGSGICLDCQIERQEARIEVLQGHVDKLVARIDHPNMLSEDL